MLDKEILAVASGLYSPLFATQDSIGDAYNYAQQIAQLRPPLRAGALAPAL